MRPTRSGRPSPLKSPTCTSTQLTAGDHMSHLLVMKADPVDCPVHHSPPCSHRPTMSALPSPLKSPTFTSTQVTFAFHIAHGLRPVVNPEPVEMPVYHWPVCSHLPVM